MDDLRPPPVGAMCRASSLLQAFAGAVPLADPVAVATAEYAFFVHQTYLFELVGLQLLGEMTARMREPVTLVALAAQAIDEARHVEIYRQLAAQSSGADDQTAVPETMYQAFVGRGSIEEKAVKAFVLLESLAVGMFAARASFYGDCAVARIDRRILHEEAQHQSAGLTILSELVATGRLRPRDLVGIVREGAAELAGLLAPTALLAQLGIEAGPCELAALQRAGLVGRQIAVSRRCIRRALRRLYRHFEEGCP
jgi:hypothetical protein